MDSWINEEVHVYLPEPTSPETEFLFCMKTETDDDPFEVRNETSDEEEQLLKPDIDNIDLFNNTSVHYVAAHAINLNRTNDIEVITKTDDEFKDDVKQSIRHAFKGAVCNQWPESNQTPATAKCDLEPTLKAVDQLPARLYVPLNQQSYDVNFSENDEPTECEKPYGTFRNRIRKSNTSLKSPYFCTFCKYMFKYKTDFARHERRAHKSAIKTDLENLFICAECGMNFASKATIAQHLRSHELQTAVAEKETAQNNTRCNKLAEDSENSYCCAYCGEIFKHKADLITHIWYHGVYSNTRKNSCPVCARQLNGYRKLRLHIATHTGDKFYHCKECSYSSTRKQKLEIHVLQHKKFKDGVRHSNIIKNTDSTFTCPDCQRVFRFRTDLMMHIRSHEVDTNPSKNTCPVCQKELRGYYKLRCHIALHIGEKFYRCNECSYACVEKEDIDRHLLTHNYR